MKKVNKLLLLISVITNLFSNQAQAFDRQTQFEFIKSKYIPQMTVTEQNAGFSFNGCQLSNLRMDITDPVSLQPASVNGLIYKSKGYQNIRSIILLPPTGGENTIDNWYANYLCSAGFQVILIQRWTNDSNYEVLELSKHDDDSIRSLSAIRHTLDFLKPSTNTQVGILGTSVGALYSTLALNFDERLTAGVLIVGGVGQVDIIGNTTESNAARLRDERMKTFGYQSHEEYIKALTAAVQIDPINFMNYSGKKNVLAFVGLKDITVPTKNQKELVKIYKAQSVEFEGNHLATIINTAFWHKDKIRDFFLENLK